MEWEGPEVRMMFPERRQNPISRSSCKIRLRVQNVSGHDFSRAGRAIKSSWALAPPVLVFSYLQFRSG
jgi:hypothetical protein